MNIPKLMRQWVLASRPQERVVADNFALQEVPVPIISEGQVLLKTQYLGVAPVMMRYMRNETTFERPMQIGDVMIGRGVGLVIESKNPNYKVGDLLQAKLGWREYAVIEDDPYFMIHRMGYPELPWSYGISSLAMSGFTALIGLQEIGLLKPSDNVLVSGAAGGVGSQVGFMAKAIGAKFVVGIAGGADKCRLLTERLGYDVAIDYKNEDVYAKLDEYFPAGIDVFFDNVGGQLLDEVLGRIARKARIIICGRISEYLLPIEQYHRHRNVYRIGLQDAKMEGFFIYNYISKFGQYERQIADWLKAGVFRPLEDISEGIETMPAALMSLYDGTNRGIRMGRIDPTADLVHRHYTRSNLACEKP
ncbi:MAG: NADP-dependent oxidoreductase [Runella sp.]